MRRDDLQRLEGTFRELLADMPDMNERAMREKRSFTADERRAYEEKKSEADRLGPAL
jgi:hypothetical protein